MLLCKKKPKKQKKQAFIMPMGICFFDSLLGSDYKSRILGGNVMRAQLIKFCKS